ncbi:MAG: hypothetical protein KVP17_000320 [Porospora cf. gigantea B]|uniref:uncharacterized protein n=1 Tax=Porospora cf. gigantea A TaxID=2853593 RepID=UPI0035597CE9|nr:MAG: hypothetical protein KVP18_005045 [Porospora cf. gigantea A]KAH0484660.1 MAG: hypothetical protein KVP17_000320 [Porospora cf. gigantea B]
MRSRESPTLFHTCLPHVVSYLDLQSLCRVSGCSRLTMVILSTFSTIWQLRCQEILRSAPASATQESFFSSEFASLVAKARLISYHATTCVERMNQAAITGSDVNVWSERLDKCRSALNAMLRQTQDPSLVTILKSLYRINFSVAIDV